jgi:hypothetical protein
MHSRLTLVALLLALLAVGLAAVWGWPLRDGGMRSTGTNAEAATLAQSNADLTTFSKAVRRLVSSELGALPKPR